MGEVGMMGRDGSNGRGWAVWGEVRLMRGERWGC